MAMYDRAEPPTGPLDLFHRVNHLARIHCKSGRRPVDIVARKEPDRAANLSLIYRCQQAAALVGQRVTEVPHNLLEHCQVAREPISVGVHRRCPISKEAATARSRKEATVQS